MYVPFSKSLRRRCLCRRRRSTRSWPASSRASSIFIYIHIQKNIYMYIYVCIYMYVYVSVYYVLGPYIWLRKRQIQAEFYKTCFKPLSLSRRCSSRRRRSTRSWPASSRASSRASSPSRSAPRTPNPTGIPR